MTKEEICFEHGHDWYINSGGFWDTAECLTCERKIRNIKLYYDDLPNPRKKSNDKE